MSDTRTPATAPLTFTPPASDRAIRGRLLWTDLMVPDVGAATQFYADVIGWALTTWSMGEGIPPYTMWTAAAGPVGGVMGMSEAEVASGAPARWLAYIGTPDVDATHRDALALGAREIVPPRDIPTVGRFAVLADPQGAGFAIFQPTNAPEPSQGAASDGQFAWIELGTADPAAAIAFYTQLFGWALTERMEMGPGQAYQMFGVDGSTFGAIYPAASAAAAQWLLYVRVPDITRSVDAVRRGGGRVLMEPNEIPGGDYIARCADPQGAEFAVLAPAPQTAR